VDENEHLLWGSHLPPLAACLGATSGPVLEIGSGIFSTPVLHAYCRGAGRVFISVEEHPQWVEKMRDFGVRFLEYDKLGELPRLSWSVVFIDHSPGFRRAQDAILFRDSAEFIVIHYWISSEVQRPFDNQLDQWKYRYVWPEIAPSPGTIILSNTREILV
jgi:hypothetical protein